MERAYRLHLFLLIIFLQFLVLTSLIIISTHLLSNCALQLSGTLDLNFIVIIWSINMDAFLQQFQHIKIQLEEITSATNNFDQLTIIGGGGFGKVYKGEVSIYNMRSMVAIKRLDPKHGQGIPEFLKEIMMLSRYRHENLISLLGFCYERNEMILVYEHASLGSLDRHLNSPHLTWSCRIKICLDAAKGLSYIHDPRETHQRLIHCDIKSANILLDDHWNAKVSDFGLSVMGPANEQHSVIVTFAAGTPGYYDPQYAMTHTLTKESDVYSFGVVLFEVLCGKLCYTHRNGRVPQILVPTWIESYIKNELDDIIFKNPTFQPLDKSSLETFSDIAYRCLKESREDRPTMAEVVTELETALEIQAFSEGKSAFDYEEITKTAKPPLNYSSKGELWKLLSKGVLLNGGKTWLSLNKKGEHCEIISFAECLNSGLTEVESEYNSRFDVGTYRSKNGIFKTRLKPQFLSPGLTYTVNLVFKFSFPARKTQLISLKYKLRGETKTLISYLADKREDGCWMCELYLFTGDHRVVDLEILFVGMDQFCYGFIEAEGIEFRPLEKVEDKDENQPISDLDVNWEEKLPADYEDIMKWSIDNMQWTTKKEAYSIIRKGFLIDDGEKWFSLDKNGKKCHMLSVSHIWRSNKEMMHLHESRFVTVFRFNEACQRHFWNLDIDIEIQSQQVSSQTTYGSYLVYKLPKDQSKFKAPVGVVDRRDMRTKDTWYIYFISPRTPLLRPKADENTHDTFNTLKIKGLPRQRNDGWMEVQIWEFQTATTTESIPMRLDFTSCGDSEFSGLIVQGVEFRSM